MKSLGRIVYNVTGIMSNKGIVKNSRKIGDAICDKMKISNGIITADEVKSIITNTIGKKGAKRIQIIDSPEEVKNLMNEIQGITSKEFEEIYTQIMGCNLPDRYKRQTFLHVRPKELYHTVEASALTQPEMVANVLTHETQHALGASSGKLSYLKKFSNIPFIRKFIDKQYDLSRKLNLQEKYTILQNKAFETPDFDTVKCKELVKSVINTGNDEHDIFIIKNLINIYKDEIRSYIVGFEAYGKYLEVNPEDGVKKITKIYEQLVETLKQEKNNIRKNQIRKFFGLNS